MELDSFVRTTGGRGLHVVVPWTPRADGSECLDFSRTPDRFTLPTVTGRLARLRTDPLKACWTIGQTIPRGAIAALDRL